MDELISREKTKSGVRIYTRYDDLDTTMIFYAICGHCVSTRPVLWSGSKWSCTSCKTTYINSHENRSSSRFTVAEHNTTVGFPRWLEGWLCIDVSVIDVEIKWNK